MTRLLPLLLLLAAGRAGATVLEIDEFRLPNGMRVVLAPDPAVPVVTFAMVVPVGARQEERGRSGFAHLFEHLMFEGSAHVRRGEFDRILESHGAQSSAWTALDYTFYYEVLPAHALPIAFWLDADRLSALSVSEESRRSQVDVVKEEKRLQVFNEPYGPLLRIEIASRTYANWANTHDTYGSSEDLSRASLTDVRRFFNAHYAPGNITVVLVGDFDPQDARRLVTRYFGWIPNRGRPPLSDVSEPEQDGERRFNIRDKHAKVGGTAIVYNGMPERGSRDYYALTLLGRMLFTGKSARLYQLLVKEKQAATAIDEPFEGGLGFPVSDWDSFRAPGLFGGFILRKPGVATEDIRRLVFGELASIAEKGVAEGDLTRVKTKFRSDWIVGLQTTLGRASLLARAAVLDGEPGAANSELERFLSVTPEEIKTAAAKYLTEQTANVFDLAPEAASESPPGKEAAETGGAVE